MCAELLANPLIESFDIELAESVGRLDSGYDGVRAMSGRRPRVAVVVFPGSNDDRDAANALGELGAEPILVWHGEERLPAVDAVVLPGGFSYGDYLRCGAIARFAPAMASVVEFARRGGLVLGICNGFQILCEAGLLPGCAAAERVARLRLPRRPPDGRAGGHAVHLPVRARADADDPREARRRLLAPRPGFGPANVVLRYADGEQPQRLDRRRRRRRRRSPGTSWA